MVANSRIRRSVAISFALLVYLALGGSMAKAQESLGNKPERLGRFRDLGFGLFIHWSFDSQLGSVISHSAVGASDDYAKRFFEELPKTFNPKRFDADEWAALAKLAGFKYVVFTAKHHSGFCMYNTGTTDFSIMSTPYGRDITAQIVRAFRDQGIAIGFYFSPDDFYFLYTHGREISRRRPGVTPQEFPELMKYDQEQIRELLTGYGKIDIVFIDGPAEGLREVCWEVQPDVIVTRGAMETPEQYTPGVPLEGAWEGNLTMGTQWHFKPTNEEYKSGTELIETLIETRAKGGNLLLNTGPHPNGRIPFEQERLLREMALWNFINGEAIYDVRPWVVSNEGDIWFTKKKDEDTVYAFVTGSPWKWGEPKTLTLRSVRASDQTKIDVLGQSGRVLEYHTEITPETTWRQDDQGLHITAIRAQRIYNNRRWPNPIVLRITQANPGLVPPVVETGSAEWDSASSTATLYGELKDLGKAEAVQVGLQYRRRKGAAEMYEPDDPWKDTAYTRRYSPGAYRAQVKGLKPGQAYEYRAVVKHPVLTLFGATRSFSAER